MEGYYVYRKVEAKAEQRDINYCHLSTPYLASY